MTPREIIAKAWAITTSEGQIRSWGFSAALLRTLLNVKLLIYQVWFAYSYFILKNPIGFFTVEEKLLEILPKWVAISIIVFLLLLLVVEIIFPHFAKGAVIGLAAKSYKKEEVKGGLVLAVYNFFPIFAAHELLLLSGVTTVITICSLLLRYAGGMAPFGISLVVTLWLLTLILEFFFIFIEEAVVIRKAGLKDAMGTSFKLVISHLGHVVFLLLLMYVILLRIVANMLMIVLIPSIVLGIGFALSSLLSHTTSFIISASLGMVIIVAASYFFAYLEVFRQTVWTITYMELSKLKELDIIEEDV